MSEGFDDWGNPDKVEVESLDLAAMDQLIKAMREKKEEYDAAKKSTSAIYKEYAELEHKVLLALKGAGKKSYKVDGLGTFSIVHKQVVTTPKTIEDKRAVFKWIQEKYGPEFCTGMLSINHATLNSFYNEEAEKAEDKAMFEIPGLEAPTVKEETRFRKA